MLDKIKKIFVYEPQCTKRRLESENIRQYFMKNGWKVVNNPSKANLIIYNSCAVIKETEDDSLKDIEFLSKFKTKMVVTGCLPDINIKKLKKKFTGIIIPSRKLYKLNKIFPNHKHKYYSSTSINEVNQKIIVNSFTIKKLIRKWSKFNIGLMTYLKKIILKDAWIVKISSGCLSNCSFCAIKHTFGHFTSKKQDLILKEFEKGIEKKFKYFSIIADDVGCYGQDLNINICELLKSLVKIQGKFKIALQEFNPFWLMKYKNCLVPILSHPTFYRICIPIQSGDPSILKRMKRYQDINELRRILVSIKKSNKKIILWTSWIIGYPGESDFHFKNSLKFILASPFQEVILFPYSDRPNTVSSKSTKKNSQETILRRIKYAKKILRKNNIKILGSKETDNIYEKCVK